MPETPKTIQLFHNGEIFLKEDTHEYIHKDNLKLNSVSSFIKFFSNPFDPTGKIIKKCAEKRGITVRQLQSEWDKTRDDACAKGTNIHSDIEYYIKNKKIKDNENKLIIKQFSKIKFEGTLYSEQLIYNKEYGLAGTIDLVEILPDNKVYIHDFKTNKKLNKKGFFNIETRQTQKMLYPVNYLEDANLIHYAIQLSTYAFLVEENGYWVEKLQLFYVNNKNKIVIYDIPFVREDVLKMIKYYQHNQSLTF
jgi:CRISPR/Cas system-associated exonuclease Cas4 (RecB family)